MDKYKFRAWKTKEKKMLYWKDLFYFHENNLWLLLNDNLSDYKVMQWTWCKDKKSVDIYEGDILDCREECGAYHEVKFMQTERGMGFDIDCSGTAGLSSFKIVGNVFENPEFLGKG